MAIQYSGGLLIILMLLPLFGGWHVQWNSTFLICLFWMAFVISVGASMMLYFMIQKGNLTNVTSLLYGVPPVTALLDYLIFKDQLSLMACFGMVFIIVRPLPDSSTRKGHLIVYHVPIGIGTSCIVAFAPSTPLHGQLLKKQRDSLDSDQRSLFGHGLLAGRRILHLW